MSAFLSRSAGIKIGKKYSAGNTDLRGIHGREPFASVLGSIGRLETLKPCGCYSYKRHHAKNLDSVGPNKLKKTISPVILKTVHTFPIYPEFSPPYRELERRNVSRGITVIGEAREKSEVLSCL